MINQKRQFYDKYNITNFKDYARVEKQLKQKLAAKACWIKVYTERSAQYNTDKLKYL